MGKNLRTQRRGRGGSTYRSPSHRHVGKVRHPRFEGEGVVVDIFHAPGRTAPLARVAYESQRVLMIAPDGLQKGQRVSVGTPAVDRGNTLPLGSVPVSTLVYNIESRPGDGGKFVRSAGTTALVVSQGDQTVLQLPSGRFRSFDPKCRATVGVVAGAGRGDKPFVKAGKKALAYRSLSKAHLRVRGVAMNAVNHPHGGGAHQHVGGPSTVSWRAPPGRKVGRLGPHPKKKGGAK